MKKVLFIGAAIAAMAFSGPTFAKNFVDDYGGMFANADFNSTMFSNQAIETSAAIAVEKSALSVPSALVFTDSVFSTPNKQVMVPIDVGKQSVASFVHRHIKYTVNGYRSVSSGSIFQNDYG